MPDFSLNMAALLFVLAAVAGTINAIAGGAGLITLPALLACGFNPLAAVATNKVQMLFSQLSATIYFWQKNAIGIRDHLLPSIVSFVMAVVGSYALSLISSEHLKIFLPIVLIGVSIWIGFFQKGDDSASRSPKLSPVVYALLGIGIVAFYDGFVGPGVGTFFAAAGVALRGLSLKEATIQAKLYNTLSNLGASLFFIVSGHVVWCYAAAMALGMVIGGYIGARIVFVRGAAFIRPLLVIISVAISVKILLQEGLIADLINH